MTRYCLYAVLALAALCPSCGSGSANSAAAPEYTYKIVNTYPHDPDAFTQGLEFHNGILYESTGQNGKSGVRKVLLETGGVILKTELPAQYFGEGITISRNQLIELTWQSQKGFIYDVERLQLLRTFSYPGEGWGLASHAETIYMSDGSPTIRLWDAATLEERSRVLVKDGDQPVSQINELEWVKGEIWANVWQSDRVARIDPATGKVNGWIDLSGLLSPDERARVDVLNGIAWDETKDRIFVTGKLWPKLFEIQIVKK